MIELWRTVAPQREFPPVFDRAGFLAWIGRTDGLTLNDYRLAWRPDGRLAGFIGVWQQDRIKRLRLHAYSPRLAVTRVLLNAAARLTRGPRLPPAGAAIRAATIVHPCIDRADATVLHALLRRAYRALRSSGCAYFTIGLDVRDPLSGAVRGLFAQPTDVHAYIATPAGRWSGPPPDSRPLYYDVGLT
jgi:hypothetical protein